MLKLLAFIICVFCVNLCIAQNTHPYRIYPFKKKVTHIETIVSTDTTVINRTIQTNFEIVNKQLFLVPSVAFDVFAKVKDTGEYTFGAMPGVGYGLKYNPFEWKKLYLAGFDIFAYSGINKDIENTKTFDIQIVPVLSLLNWIHIGYGYRWRLGLKDAPDSGTTVFVFGVSKSL